MQGKTLNLSGSIHRQNSNKSKENSSTKQALWRGGSIQKRTLNTEKKQIEPAQKVG
jgi:hypothetical protein